MVSMPDWISQVVEPMKYYSKEKDTEEACEHLMRDTLVPLQFEMQCRNSGDFAVERESAEMEEPEGE